MPNQPSRPPADPFAGYAPPVGEFDEAVSPLGQIRPHWQPYQDTLIDFGGDELARRWRDAQRLIRDNGVTYNVHGDPGGTTRPWQLDPIPVLISSADAIALEAGLTQRARLLELILTDLYGPQRLLREGHLPAELVFANPGFLRPLHGLTPVGGRFLHLYAANLGRGADGVWRVLGDRTQAPSGAGYALENRIVMARAFPEAFRECGAQRLALFFRTLRDGLRGLAPRNKDNPRVVLLTPGPFNETYFEHAYLARYLGYTLAEGGDLTVRDNRVYMKVLDGLQPVDVIFRRLDDDYCDPLELRPDSFLGIPGLTHAVRCGNVAVANALGSGLLETPALLAYLPALCRHLLGEDLRLDSVPTWWCGDPAARTQVFDSFPEMVLKRTFPADRQEPIFVGELSTAERATLADRVRARPTEYVAQRRLSLSTVPIRDGYLVLPRRMVFRTYLAAEGTDGFAVMPGGLTRVSGTADGVSVSMRQGGGSKDTWVLSTSPVSEFSLLSGTGRGPLTRAGGDLPSRAADNLFWLGRHAERADGLCRLLRGVAVRFADREGAGIPALLRALHRYRETPVAGNAETVLTTAVYDPDEPTGLAAVLRTAWQVAGTVRDRMSLDMWRVLNGLSDPPADPTPADGIPPTPAETLTVLNRTIVSLAAFGGLVAENMTRSDGWRFLSIGRRLERVLFTVAVLRGGLGEADAPEEPTLDALLEVADSSMTYRRRYMSSLRAEAVLDLLVFDETNPRSLAAQLTGLYDDVNNLPRPAGAAGRSPEQRFALAALNAVQLAEPERLADLTDGTRGELVELLEHVGGWMPILSDVLTQQYLTHLQAARHLAAPDPARRPTASGDAL